MPEAVCHSSMFYVFKEGIEHRWLIIFVSHIKFKKIRQKNKIAEKNVN